MNTWIIIITATLVLTACGGEQASTDEDTTTDTPAVQETPVEPEPDEESPTSEEPEIPEVPEVPEEPTPEEPEEPTPEEPEEPTPEEPEEPTPEEPEEPTPEEPEEPTPEEPGRQATERDTALLTLVTNLGFSPSELRDRSLPQPGDPIVELGKELFFSRSLSFEDDVACVSCHDPRLAGTDNLSLPVGVGAHDPLIVGPGRRHDGNYYIDPKADFGPNVPRNSPTTFNIAFYDKAMFWDGRVETVAYSEGNSLYLPVDSGADNGEGALIRTPDSFSNGPDHNAGNNLTTAQARFPVTSVAEMRGFSAAAGQTSKEIRRLISVKLAERGWEMAFREGFNDYVSELETLLSYDNIAFALAEYQRSQVAIDNRFFDYLDGNTDALSAEAVEGGILFFSENQGGCYQCHAGPHFSDENYYALATPQIGRGKNSFSQDYGRYNITRSTYDRHSFRTPSLLNVGLTFPYMHAGSLGTLREAINWHFNPVTSLRNFDFSLQNLEQYAGLGVDTSESASLVTSINYSYMALKYAPGYSEKLSMPQATATQLDQYEAFLTALSSQCLQDLSCVSAWMPDYSTPSPDGMRIEPVLSYFDNSEVFTVTEPEGEETGNAVFPDLSDIPPYPDAICALPSVPSPVETDVITGFRKKESLPVNREIGDSIFDSQKLYLESVLMSGSVASGDIDGDCDFDLVVDGGEGVGILIFLNENGEFTQADNNYGLVSPADTASFSLTDVNGDGWPDIFYGHMLLKDATLWLNNGRGQFLVVSDFGFSSIRKTHNAAFADLDGDGDLDMFTANWDAGQSLVEPHLWYNDGRGYYSARYGTGIEGSFNERDFTLSPNFADMNGDGHQDLLVASDFLTSHIFTGNGDGTFNDVTDISVITDENAMGAGIGDIDNDGDLDWFVTNIYDAEIMSGEETRAEGNWGATGNRLYRNNSIDGSDILLEDITDAAGVRDGGWGWGVCMKDFNNDGWLDIFHVNGFGYEDSSFNSPLFNALQAIGFTSVMELAIAEYNSASSLLTDLYGYFVNFEGVNFILGGIYESESALIADLKVLLEGAEILARTSQAHTEFFGTPARLFMNNKDGSFTEQAFLRGIADTGEGRGIACNDFDRDGDIDIVILNHSGAPSYYENHFRRTLDFSDNFLNIRLRGTGGNQYAYGAKVYVTAGSLSQYREMRFENNYISNNAPELHFGLAAHSNIDEVRIEWPDGQTTTLNDVDPNQFLVVRHPSLAD